MFRTLRVVKGLGACATHDKVSRSRCDADPLQQWSRVECEENLTEGLWLQDKTFVRCLLLLS